MTHGNGRRPELRATRHGELAANGDLICKRSHAIGVAPQLTGILRRWREVVLDSHLRVPAALVNELLAAWALLPIPHFLSEEGRQEVGDRAEAYSYRLEQDNSRDPSRVQWVALDDASLGYDIRNTDGSPVRCIEVKGSQEQAVRFFLSSNEWEVGHSLGEAYEVHFWGGISLTRPRPEEYRALRDAGYPLIFRDLGATIAAGALVASPSEYLVTAAARSSSPKPR
jgi:hypothetical protein